MHLHVCFCYDQSHCKGKEGQYGIPRQGVLEHAIVMAGALMHMCGMCGALGQAQNVLQRLPSCVFLSCIALFAGYAQNGQGNALGSKAIAQVGPREIDLLQKKLTHRQIFMAVVLDPLDTVCHVLKALALEQGSFLHLLEPCM